MSDDRGVETPSRIFAPKSASFGQSNACRQWLLQAEQQKH
jgi:hypothetical protein